MIVLNRTTAVVTFVAVAATQGLLFIAGWLLGCFAGGPSLPSPVAPPPPIAMPAIAAPRAVVVELRPTRPPAPRPPAPRGPVAYDALLRAAARRHGLSPLLLRAVTRVESDFDPRDLSDKGARGLMQVMPETGARFGVSAERLFEPAANIAAGSAYLAWLLDRYHGDLDLALAAYNAGEGAVDQHRGIPPFRETETYVKRVRTAMVEMHAQ